MSEQAIGRRDFLKIGGLASGAGLIGANSFPLAGATPAKAAPPREVDFLDRRWIHHTYFLERRLTQGERFLPGPVMEENSGQATIRPSKDGFAMWYSSLFPGVNDPSGDHEHWIRYATTRDGLRFDQPELGLRSRNGSKANNILLGIDETDADGRAFNGNAGSKGFCIIDAEVQPAPGTRGRYTALYLTNTPGRPAGLHLAYSDDGFRWKAYPENPVYRGWPDSFSNFFFDERYGHYVVYMRPSVISPRSDRRWANRMMARAVSDDLVHWRGEQVVLDTDDRDAPAIGTVKEARHPNRTAPNGVDYARGRNRQIYGMTVTPHQDGYLGFASIYDLVTASEWIELVHSHDGINWKREARRTPFIPLGKKGDWDSGMTLWVPAGCPIAIGDEWYVYYGGYNFNHRIEIVLPGDAEKKRSLGVVRLKRGRFVGYTAQSEPGYLITKPFPLEDSEIALNADAHSGEILVEVCDAMGRPLKGLSLKQSIPISKDGLRLRVAFNDGAALTTRLGKTVRLRMRLTNATIYGLAFGK